MRQQLCEVTTEEEFLAQIGHKRIVPVGDAHLDQVRDEPRRVPGPLPTLDRLDQIESSELTPVPEHVVAAVASEPVSLPDDLASSYAAAPLLARLRSPLQFGFTALLLLDLPFIVYALCWHAGFDLTVVTYPLLGAFLAVSTVAVWLPSRGLGLAKIGALVARTPMVPWMSLQLFPISGFVLWHHGGFGGMDRLIPLFVIALAFIFSVGLPNAPWGTSARDTQWDDGASGRVPRVDQSRALSRW